MDTAKFLNDFAKQFCDSLPPSLKEARTEIEKHFQQALKLAFAKLKLVTREEFDIQTAVLSRTQDKVEQLEHQLSILETELYPQHFKLRRGVGEGEQRSI